MRWSNSIISSASIALASESIMLAMDHRREFVARRGADTLSRRIGREQVRDVRRSSASRRRINWSYSASVSFGIVEDVIAIVVAIDLIAQARNFRLELFSLGGHGERVSQKGLEVT